MASSTPESSVTGGQDEQLFQQLDSYPWDADEEFQSGLQAILGRNPSPAQAWHARQGNATHVAANGSTVSPSRDLEPSTRSVGASDAPSSSSAEPPAPYPLSFNHIVELITTGLPIPGIKDIPDTVLEGQASQTVQTRRKKPWEKPRDGDVSTETASETVNESGE